MIKIPSGVQLSVKIIMYSLIGFMVLINAIIWVASHERDEATISQAQLYIETKNKVAAIGELHEETEISGNKRRVERSFSSGFSMLSEEAVLSSSERTESNINPTLASAEVKDSIHIDEEPRVAKVESAVQENLAESQDVKAVFEKVKSLSTDYKSYRDSCIDTELISRWRNSYFPKGGIRALYCNLKSEISFAVIRKAVGEDVFANTDSHKVPNLYSKNQFGHYNKKFLEKIYSLLDEIESDGSYKSLQPVYDTYFRDLFRIYYTVYKSLNINSAFRKAVFFEYQNSISNNLSINVYKFTECPNIQAYWPNEYKIEWSMQYYVSSTAVYFWLRRGMDDTEVKMFDILKRAIYLYDRNFISAVEQVVVDRNLIGEICYRPVYD
ncbi:MAG: hypothetical protein V4660_20095 [Pseudomonadota bacterium]